MCQCVVNRRADRRHLRRVALRGRRSGAVGVNLGGRLVARVGDAGTQAEPLERVLDDAGRDHGRSDDLAAAIRRRDVRDFLHRCDHRLLELGLRMLAIVDQIEAVWDFTRLERYAVTSGQRRAKSRTGSIWSTIASIRNQSFNER